AFVIALLLISASGLAARNEPEPWPQLDLPQSLDYSEAKSLLSKQKWAEATIVLRGLVKSRPEFQPALMGLARALSYSGRREEALAVLAHAVERANRREKPLLIRRARVLSRAFLTNGTQQIYQDGVNLLVSGKYRAARERLDRALHQEADNAEILSRLG